MKQLLIPLFFLLFRTPLSSQAHSQSHPFAFFNPPPGWVVSNPCFLGKVKIGFIKSKRETFAPAISLLIEKISCSEKEYVDGTKKIHRSDPTQDVRTLGLIETKSGQAHLFQIDTENSWGRTHILQAILIKEGFAYVQTATFLKEDFLSLSDQILKSFKSLLVMPTPFSHIENHQEMTKKFNYLNSFWKRHCKEAGKSKEELFKDPLFQKKHWLPFVESIVKSDKNFRICWQILATQYMKEELMR